MRRRYLAAGSQAVGVDQVIGKDLFAKVPVQVRNAPRDNAGVMKTLAKGDRVGKVYSWVYGKDANGNNTADIWWMIDKDTLKPYYTYVKHNPSSFDWKVLKQQGAKTEVEKQAEKEEESKSFTDKMGDFIKDSGKKVLIGGAILGSVWAGVQVYKAYKA